MQYYRQRYPKVVKLKRQELGLVVVEDIHSGDTVGIEHSLFHTFYEQMNLKHALEALDRDGSGATLQEIHSSLCKNQGTTVLDRLVLVVALFLSALTLFAGVKDSRLLRILFGLVRLAAAHGTTLERIVHQQVVGGDDA